MFYGVTHVDVPVTDIPRAREFWGDLIGLRPGKSGEGFADMDSGNVALRLIQVRNVEHPVSIRISVRDVEAAYEQLLRHGGTSLYEPLRTPELELVANVVDPDGNSVFVWRELTEDEWDFVPALPKEGEWHEDAERLLVQLLSHVPALFRALARRKATRMVEHLAKTDRSPVTREHVINGYILSSAKITRYRLVEPLRKSGINPDDYKAVFEEE
jgi:predicted enzyme related to lactoylglutathione lyase